VIVILDTVTITLLITEASVSQEAKKCQEWFYKILSRGGYIVAPQICDYEVRRGLLLVVKRTGKSNSQKIKNLNRLKESIEFLPCSQEILEKASEIWAENHYQGTPTASLQALDVDIIIGAHWQILKNQYPGRYVVIATSNIKHLSIFAEAQEWKNINL